ncbi:hypothetical protein CDCA_CDCA01G0076 [Cyanidium caldarium]|uniref:(R)-citramalate synthase n=1 Tax=Cyanidium caldarium TaxID=2771 RepID=A0AAV9IPB7_CYACA|nr:hypothetical protein CDCA_CDCA01G0076 [Cyanidium caldarium]
MLPDCVTDGMAFVTLCPTRASRSLCKTRLPSTVTRHSRLGRWRRPRHPRPLRCTASASSAPQSQRTASLDALIYDTTLRDGTQGEGVSLSCQDKLSIARELDQRLGVAYIECGWPGSNPKDAEFFMRARAELTPHLRHAQLVAFGATRYKNTTCAADKQVQALLEAHTPVVTIVGKASEFHVTQILGTTLDENLAMIRETVAFLRAAGRQVMLDAEHFFDGYFQNAEYALECLGVAADAGASAVVLCDTNGGSVPWDVQRITERVRQFLEERYASTLSLPTPRIGIHCHNDMEMAVANTLAAVRGGAIIVQGCINGYGERTGNASLTSVIPALQLRLGRTVLPPPTTERLAQLTGVSRFVDELANRPHVPWRPFVGECAFAHKGGLHVAAFLKHPVSYQFVDPAAVGNRPRVLVSELSGRGNILTKVRQMDVGFDENDPVWRKRLAQVLERVKALENKGFTFEAADASLEMLVWRASPSYVPPFELVDFSVFIGNKRVLFVNHEGCFVTEDGASATGSDILAHMSASSSAPAMQRGNGTNAWSSLSGGPLFVSPANLADAAAQSARDLTADPAVAVFRNETHTQAVIKMVVGSARPIMEVAEGNGPVDAVNRALRKALAPHFLALDAVTLDDYKVRILDAESATAAITRVLVSFRDSRSSRVFTTVSSDANIIVASVNALVDGLEYAVLRATDAGTRHRQHEVET